jgi:hypothetical protein
VSVVRVAGEELADEAAIPEFAPDSVEVEPSAVHER